ncbi:hypothetical protein GOBAR_AA09871 [Gossypium barbadense]|uniref:Uncharacterized protein n=1 Tax=Gossypium barbadense TaxID=3634 RepID=A0A2P5Y583_GOSBA|nr:hypothetical protein GOBAR_AA09871 [Gossypium barbadense]
MQKKVKKKETFESKRKLLIISKKQLYGRHVNDIFLIENSEVPGTSNVATIDTTPSSQPWVAIQGQVFKIMLLYALKMHAIYLSSSYLFTNVLVGRLMEH